MALSTLDPRTALVVIDLQKGIVGATAAQGSAEIVRQATRLADAFRALELPVVIVNVEGAAPGRAEQKMNVADFPADWTELVIEHQPGDYRITKQTWGAFTKTDLATLLETLGVTQIVLAGISTSAGIESTGRAAHERGLNVSFATDAMTDRDAEAQANSLSRIFPRIGETGTVAEIIDLLNA